jgi:hypothetical protein
MIDGHRPLKNLAIIAERRGSDTHRYCGAARLGAAKLRPSPTPLVHMADVTASTLDILAPGDVDTAHKKKRPMAPLYINTAVALAHRPAWTGHASRLIDTG